MTRLYTTASAVVTGSEHLRSGIGCQDAVALRHLDDGGLLVAVSDGAGSARHPEIGARLAVESALSYLASAEPPDPTALVTHVQAALRAEADRLEVPLSALSCTLLVAKVGPDAAFFAQVGDGAIVTRGADSELSLVFPPHKGEHANETRFVTASDAAAHVQSTTQSPAPTALALLTDGLERQALDLTSGTPFAPFFAPFFAALSELSELIRLIGPRDLAPHALPTPPVPTTLEAAESELSAELAAFLASPRVAEATGDDVTLVLALR